MKKPKESEVIRRYPIESLGTTHRYVEIVICPECHFEYAREVSSGCFHHTKNPIMCPKCGYPFKQIDERKAKRELNPSRREQK